MEANEIILTLVDMAVGSRWAAGWSVSQPAADLFSLTLPGRTENSPEKKENPVSPLEFLSPCSSDLGCLLCPSPMLASQDAVM